MVKPLVAVSAGASLGAIIHCSLGRWLNAAYPLVPLGTLAAHVLGGYCIGLALSLFACRPVLGPEWRLLIVTGFLGALTTFSTFSAEIGLLLQQYRFFGQWGPSPYASAVHRPRCFLAWEPSCCSGMLYKEHDHGGHQITFYPQMSRKHGAVSVAE